MAARSSASSALPSHDQFALPCLPATHRKADEDRLFEILRADAKVLQKLRHPGIVKVMEALDESKGAMAMVTEPVFSSVANALGNFDNLPKVPRELEKLVCVRACVCGRACVCALFVCV